MQMVGQKITAIGHDGGNRDLDLRIVDGLRDLTSDVAKKRPDSRSPYDGQEKLPDAFSRAESTRKNAGKQDLEKDHCCSVVQKTLSLDNDREPFIHVEGFEDGEDGNRIGGRDDGPEQKRDQKGQTNHPVN